MSDDRNRQLARIHIMRQQLRMDDDTYRAMLMTVARTHSAARLDDYGRRQVIHHMAALLPKAKPAKKKEYPQDRKIRVLWAVMHQAGIIRNGSEAALRAYVKRQTGCERLEWINSKQASNVIETLKQWQKREEEKQGDHNDR